MMALRVNLNKALEKIKEQRQKKEDKEKAKERGRDQRRQEGARLSDMQLYVDMHPKKRAMLLEVLKMTDPECGLTIAEKGAIIYTRLLDVAQVLKEDLENAGYDVYVITSAQTQNKRSKIVESFKTDSANKIVIISEAGGESVSLQSTNELILYNVPRGPGRWAQIIGRVARMFCKYGHFNIHFVTVKYSIDEYMQILLSSKKELEEELLVADTIPLKEEGKFNQLILRQIRHDLLWRKGLRKKPPSSRAQVDKNY
jgi:superfamily II DNA or RNA helicase